MDLNGGVESGKIVAVEFRRSLNSLTLRGGGGAEIRWAGVQLV